MKIEVVTIKPEYCDKNENPNVQYFVKEDNGSRIDITPCVTSLVFAPIETVDRKMVNHVGFVNID